MGVKIIDRVLDTSGQRGAARLLLVVLADFANDDGVCWPGTAKLSEKINEDERYTRTLITKLLESGELLRIVGGGRGKPTFYGIACGLNDTERLRLQRALERTSRINAKNPAHQYRVSRKTPRQSAEDADRNIENPALQNRVSETPVLQNRDLSQQKTGFFESGLNGPNGAPASQESMFADSANHDHDPCVGVGVGALAQALDDRGLNPTTIERIVASGLDPETVITSLDNMLADAEVVGKDRDQAIGRFVQRLRLTPPEKGKPYERQRVPGPGPRGDGPHGSGRTNGGGHRERASGRRPRPGDLAYYDRYAAGADGETYGE